MRFRIMKSAYYAMILATGLVIVAGLAMGCSSQPKACTECESISTHIKQAEQWMGNHSTKLVYPGDWTKEFKADYEHHHRWIEVRDALHSAKVEGRDE